MSSKDNDQPSDSQPAPTPTSHFVGLRHLFRSFSTPDTKPSPIPSDPKPEPEPPRSDSPVEDEQSQSKSHDDVESVASSTPLQRFWRHARTKTIGVDESSPLERSLPEPRVTTEHVSRSPTLSRSPSTAAEELDAVSPIPTTLITPPGGVSNSTPLSEEEHPTPASLAQRIHSIIASTPTTMYQPMALESPKTPGDRDLPQSPVQSPRSLLSPVADARFLSFLHSPKIMNSPGLGQPSVFSVLERLQSPMSRTRDLPPDGSSGQDGHGMEVADDGSSLMLCSPLIPQRDSLVEIAETEYVPFNGAGRMVAEGYRSPLHQAHTVDDSSEESETDDDDEGGGSPRMAEGDSAESKTTSNDGGGESSDALEAGSRSIFRWPWSKTEAEKSVEQKAKEERQRAVVKAKEQKPKNEKLVWVPSPTKISLQTMWWGYRIYFPPPVLEVLNNKQLEAAKRAAMITGALQWLLDNVPIALIPPQFQLALSLLRGLVPVLGYLGSFIAWSWSAIRVFDRGCGVTLTATWLLPIAVIPGTWQVYELPSTPQVTQGETPSQPEPNETGDPVPVETQKEVEPAEKMAVDDTESPPEQKASASREPDQDQTWGSQSFSYVQKPQPPQEHWDSNPSATWASPEHGYPNPMYSSSSGFHCTQPYYPPVGHYTYTPMPIYEQCQPVNVEHPPETYQPAMYGPVAPPPVLFRTIPLPSSRSNTPSRRR